MSIGAIIFWLGSWAMVISLTVYCFVKIMRGGKK